MQQFFNPFSKKSVGKLTSSPIVHRNSENPLLTAKDVPFPCDLAFNAGCIKFRNRYYMAFRYDKFRDDDRTKGLTISGTGLAESDDGIHWLVHENPITFHWKGKTLDWINDARLTVLEDKLYLSFCFNSLHGERPGFAVWKGGDDFDDGYLPEAIINYIALLGWCPKNSETEFFNLEELKSVFTIDGVSKSPAVFDFEKLLWFNGEYIHKFEQDKFDELVKRFITTEIPAHINTPKMLALLRTRISKLSEINEKMDFFINLPEYDKELFLNKKNKISEYETVKLVLTNAREILANVDSFDNDSLFAALAPLTESLGLKTGTIMWCVRIAVSGMTATPGGATEIMEVIGKTESLARIDSALERL